MSKPDRSIALLLSVLLFASAAQLYGEPAYVISEETYDIAGRTRTEALIAVIGKAVGMTFASRDDLETFVRNRRQRLENLRSFKTSSIEIHENERSPETGETVPVTLTVRIVDGTPYFPIPYLFYNSNDGFQAGLLLTAPNVGGSLQNAIFMGLYTAPPDENDRLQWTDPNYLFLTNWSGLRLSPFKIDLTGSAMKMGQRIESRGVSEVKMDAIQLTGSIKVAYPLSETLANTVGLKISGTPQSRVDYINDPAYLAYGPIQGSWQIENNLSVTDVDWRGNFRTGYKMFLSGSYSSIEPRFAEHRTDSMLTGEIVGYAVFGNRWNPSFRVHSFINSGLPLLNGASNIRGIRNTELKGNVGLFVNTGVQIKLVRLGAAELHLMPGLDYALMAIRENGEWHNEGGFGAGSDLILVFDAMKAFPIKLGAAYDLRPKYGDDIAQRIEVDFKFSFSY